MLWRKNFTSTSITGGGTESTSKGGAFRKTSPFFVEHGLSRAHFELDVVYLALHDYGGEGTGAWAPSWAEEHRDDTDGERVVGVRLGQGHHSGAGASGISGLAPLISGHGRVIPSVYALKP